MPLNMIETLFTLRTNVLAMCDLRSTWRAPFLLLMALFVWCLGIATIYPPGGLVITFEPYTSAESSNMSVMNPPIPRDLDFASNASFPTLVYNVFTSRMPLTVFDPDTNEIFQSYPAANVISYRYVHWSAIYALFNANLDSGPTPALTSIARSIIINDQVFNLPGHPGENATYELQFRGPQFRCNVSTYNSSIPLEYDKTFSTLSGAVFVSAWLNDSLTLSVKQHNISSYSVLQNDQNTTSYQAHVETTERSCSPKSVLYNADVSFPRGVQKIEHRLSDEKEILNKWKEEDDNHTWGDQTWATMSLILPAEQQAIQDYNQKVSDTLPAYNQWALLDALGSLLDGVYHEEFSVPLPDNPDCTPETNPENGTVIKNCEISGLAGMFADNLPPNSPATPLQGTVFQPNRFTQEAPRTGYDPRSDLDLTEPTLNDVLTNITLSAISLGTWWDEIAVNHTQYYSTYSFANPLNVILPYSICLAVATAFAAIAIWSLSRNGIPAADGGFLQIMTTTRGNTEMERLVLREKLRIVEDYSVELKALKVRYGELVGEGVVGVDGRTMGFGTIEETISLRKRK